MQGILQDAERQAEGEKRAAMCEAEDSAEDEKDNAGALARCTVLAGCSDKRRATVHMQNDKGSKTQLKQHWLLVSCLLSVRPSQL